MSGRCSKAIFLTSRLSQLEDLEVTVADHIQKVLKPNFGAAWEEVGDEFEKEETFALASVRTLDGTIRPRAKAGSPCSACGPMCACVVQRRWGTSSASWGCSRASAPTKFPKTRTRTSSSSPVGVLTSALVAAPVIVAQSDVSLLSGVFRGGHDVLVRARLALADGVTMQVTVRSSEETVVDVILASVG